MALRRAACATSWRGMRWQAAAEQDDEADDDDDSDGEYDEYPPDLEKEVRGGNGGGVKTRVRLSAVGSEPHEPPIHRARDPPRF